MQLTQSTDKCSEAVGSQGLLWQYQFSLIHVETTCLALLGSYLSPAYL